MMLPLRSNWWFIEVLILKLSIKIFVQIILNRPKNRIHHEITRANLQAISFKLILKQFNFSVMFACSGQHRFKNVSEQKPFSFRIAFRQTKEKNPRQAQII